VNRLYATCGLLAVLGLSSSCVPGEPFSGVGLTRTSDSEIAIQTLLCPAESVRSVTLLGADDRVLWRIDGPSGNSASEFVVGTAPRGFVTVTPLQPIKPDDSLGLDVETDRRHAGTIEFTPKELKKDQVLSDRGLTSPNKYSTMKPDC